MTKARYWQLAGGRYGGITARGKRFIVKSLKAAQNKIGRTTKTVKSTKDRKKRKSVRTMAKKNRRRSFFSVNTIFKWLRVAALVAPAARYAMAKASGEQKLKWGIMAYTGFNMDSGRFRFDKLAEGWMPYIVTTLVTKGVQKLGGIIRSL